MSFTNTTIAPGTVRALLAAERAILTYDQWTALQDQLRERLERHREDFGGPRMGGGRGGEEWEGGGRGGDQPMNL